MTPQMTVWPHWYAVRADVLAELGTELVRFLAGLVRQGGPGWYSFGGGELLVRVEPGPSSFARRRCASHNIHKRRRTR